MGTAFEHELEDRFLRYVKIDTTADPASPTIALLAHVDTAPQFPGKDVKPIVLGPGYPVRL